MGQDEPDDEGAAGDGGSTDGGETDAPWHSTDDAPAEEAVGRDHDDPTAGNGAEDDPPGEADGSSFAAVVEDGTEGTPPGESPAATDEAGDAVGGPGQTDSNGTAAGANGAPAAPDSDAELDELVDASDADGGAGHSETTVGTGRALSILSPDEGFPEPTADDRTDRDRVESEVLSGVESYFESYDGPFETPDSDFVESAFFDFGYLDRFKEIERRWVNQPFAYVSVVSDPAEREHRYHVVEPALDEFERYVRSDLVEFLRNSLLFQDIAEDRDKATVFEEEVTGMVADHARSVDAGTLHKLLYYLRRDFIQFGPIDPIMRDPAIEDVSCDGANVPVYVYHRAFRDLRTNVSFEGPRLSSYAVRLAQRAGKSISVSDPLLDATLPDGSRLQLTLGGEVSSRGSNFTIRKFSDVPFSPIDMINWNTFSVGQMAYFWLAIENNKSLIFAGGTGSGKTSSMNAISFFVPPNSKVVSIEDTREIDLPHDNWVQSVTRSSASDEGRGEVSMYRLLQAALRQRPEYILVGEIRTEERVALTFFQAMGTGHTAYTTMHADSIDTVINRLQNPPLSVPTAMIQDLDIVSIQKQTFVDEDRVRRNQQVTEMIAPEHDVNSIRTQDVFRRDAATDTHERVGESIVMTEIAEERGWSDNRLHTEIERREGLLEFMLEEAVTDYRDVAALIQLYHKDPDYVLDRVRAQGYDLP